MSYVSRGTQAIAAYRTARTLYPAVKAGWNYLTQNPVSRDFPTYRYPGYTYPGKSMSGYTQGTSAPVARASLLSYAQRRRAPFGTKGKKAPLKRRVRALEKQARDERSVLTYKVSGKDALRAGVAQAQYGYASCVQTAAIETAAGNARFFDPAAPGTLVTASLVTGTYQSKFRVQVRSQITIRNNYQTPCIVHLALVRPKVATSTDPNTATANGWVDQGNPSNTSAMLHWSDSRQFRETYKFIRKPKKILLQAGQQVSFTCKQKSFLYDPAYFDSNTATYQPAARSKIWIYRVQGVPGHDSAVSTEVGLIAGGIDVYPTDTYTIFYNSGGATLDTIVLSNGASTSFTNGGLVSQVVRDNQAYSVS